MNQEKPQIWFGAIFWKDLKAQALQVKEVESLLNDALDLSNYGSSLQSIDFIPIALKPSNKVHEEERHYSLRKKKLSLHLKMDFEKVTHASPEGFLPLIAQFFLEAIDEAPRHQIKNFDWPRFKKDVTELFEAEGWLQTA